MKVQIYYFIYFIEKKPTQKEIHFWFKQIFLHQILDIFDRFYGCKSTLQDISIRKLNAQQTFLVQS